MLQLRYSGFFVEDVPKTISFYEQAFGLEQRYLHPSGGYAELETGDTLLVFLSEKFLADSQLLGGAPFRANRGGSPPIGALIAFVTENIDRDWARALAAGATVVKAPEAKPWGQTAGYLTDPNGVLIELCTRSPRDQP